jgi:hypothetical protein
MKFKFLLVASLLLMIAHLGLSQQSQIYEAKKLVANAKELMKDVGEYQRKANDAFEKLKRVDGLGKIPLEVPFDNPNGESSPYKLCLNSVVMEPNGAKAEVFMQIEKSLFASPSASTDVSDQEKYIRFAAKDISFTKKGGFTGETNLVLLGDASIQISEDINLKLYAINPYNNNVTHVHFSCNGFVQMHLSASLEISSNVAFREDDKGKPIKDKPLLIDFETDIADLNNWLFEINNIPSFQFKSMPDFSFAVTSLVYDKSLIANSDAMPNSALSPTEYPNPLMWTGFYCKQAVVKFPQYMRSKAKGTARTTFEASELRIDRTGFAGILDVGRTLKNPESAPVFEDGAIGTWKYSIDGLHAEFKNSRLDTKNFSLNGILDFPIAGQKEERSTFEYSASYVNELLTFSVAKPDAVYDFTFLKALEVKVINPSLAITVSSNKEEFNGVFKANVDMRLDAKASKSGEEPIASAPSANSTSVIGILFEGLTIQSYEQFFNVQKVTLSTTFSTSTLSNFPVTISNPSLTVANNKLSLGIDLGINVLGGKNATSFGGKGTILFNAKRDVERDKWRFSGVTLGALCLSVESSAFDFNGCLFQFAGDERYGDGFQATLNAKFIKKIEVKATALFGKMPDVIKDDKAVEGKKYWFVDAGVTFPAFPIFTGVGINGFFGGAYYNMSLAIPSSTTNEPKVESCKLVSKPGELAVFERGCSTSGIRFLPETEGGDRLGIRAGIGLVSMPTPTAFSGNITFGVEFVKDENDGSFSVAKVTFDGKVKFITPGVETGAEGMKEKVTKTSLSSEVVKVPIDDCEQGITVDWVTSYNVKEKVLAGSFGIKVNFKGVIQGGHPGCDAGRTELYFSEKKWYIWIGQPTIEKAISLKYRVYLKLSHICAWVPSSQILCECPCLQNLTGSMEIIPTLLKMEEASPLASAHMRVLPYVQRQTAATVVVLGPLLLVLFQQVQMCLLQNKLDMRD